MDGADYALEFGGVAKTSLPALVIFDDVVPDVFEGDLLNSLEVKQWMVQEVKSNDIEVIDEKVLR